MSRTRCQTSSSSTARSAEANRYSGRSPAVRTSPSGVGAKPCSSTAGLAAASSSSATGSPPAAGAATVRWRLRGWMPLSGTPLVSYSMPSAWNPGPWPEKPGSTTTSARHPAHSDGTVPSSRSQLVDQGFPHSVPARNGSNGSWRTRATGTGTPGMCRTESASGVRAEYWAGRMNW